MRFDIWLNFLGPAPAGVLGSTQISGAGIGTSGTAVNYPGVANSIWFAGTGDGNSGTDFRAYSPAAAVSQVAGNVVYAAPGGVLNNTSPFYTALFPARTAPAAQISLFPSQTGIAQAGSLGWAWHEMKIDKIGDIVTWQIDGTRIATLDASTNGVLSGDNIMFMQGDINSTAATDPNGPTLTFGLFDNIEVIAVPEPAAGTIACIGALGYCFFRGRRKQ